MHDRRFPVFCCLLTIFVIATASVAAGADPAKLWHGNRITPEQPFPARVLGVIPSWIGYALLLKEITDKEPRYCIAKLWATDDLEYTIVKDKKAFREIHDSHKATYLDPGVPVNDFSWSIGAYTIGRRFGEEDFVSQQYPRLTKRGDSGTSFGLPSTFSGRLSEEQEQRVPKALRKAYLVESLRSTTESELARELKHKTQVAEETRDGKRYVALQDLRHVTFSDRVSGHMIVIERHLVIADPPDQRAVIAALHLLVANGEAEHVKAILEERPDLVDSKRTFKQPHKPVRTDDFSPLHHAVENGHEAVVSVLLEHDADVNGAAGLGWTPLHLAAQRGHLAVVKQLVEHGAKVDAKTVALPESFEIPPAAAADDDTKPIRLPAIPALTALDVAKKQKHANVVEFLESLDK